MKCNNCPAQRSDYYETPSEEYYCGIGKDMEEAELQHGECGCRTPHNKIVKMLAMEVTIND